MQAVFRTNKIEPILKPCRLHDNIIEVEGQYREYCKTICMGLQNKKKNVLQKAVERSFLL